VLELRIALLLVALERLADIPEGGLGEAQLLLLAAEVGGDRQMDVRVRLRPGLDVDPAVGQCRRRPQGEIVLRQVEQHRRRRLRLVTAGEREDLVVIGDAVLARRQMRRVR